MSKFASGKKAYFISDRSGQRYRYRDAKREWNGFIVGPDEFEPKHPQLFPVRNISDPQALRDPRPDNQNIFSVNITFPTFDLTTVRHIPVPAMLGSVGQVIATGTATGEAISVTITGISAEGYVGSVVASNIASATAAVTGVAGTSAVGSVSVLAITVYTVTVASGTNSYGYGNKYYIAGLSGASPTLTLNEGSTHKQNGPTARRIYNEGMCDRVVCAGGCWKLNICSIHCCLSICSHCGDCPAGSLNLLPSVRPKRGLC